MLDSIQPPQNYPPQIKRRRVWPWLFLLLPALTLVLVGTRLSTLAKKVLDTSSSPLAVFGKLFISQDKPLAGEQDSEHEVRILLLGIGGEGHEGPLLTDTMLLLTVKFPKKSNEESKIGLVSIPRDLNVYIPGQDFRKINSAYAYGGASLARETAERLIGEKIPYYAVIDFQGFERVIDDLGGITINVEQTFTDREFPDEHLGFLPPITFEKGLQKMNGQRALQYVRSRHGDNGQNSDFARSRRQEQVLEAIWDKSKDLRVVANPGLLNRVLSGLADNFHTNLEPSELKRLYSLAKNLKKQNIVSLAIDQDSGLVCSEILPETGAYILIPCRGLANYDAIRELLKNQFTAGALAAEHPVIEIQNATQLEGLSQRTQSYLALAGLQLLTGNFRGAAVYNETVLYDNTQGRKPETLAYLKAKLAPLVAGGVFPFPTQSQAADFVIVVARDLVPKLP